MGTANCVRNDEVLSFFLFLLARHVSITHQRFPVWPDSMTTIIRIRSVWRHLQSRWIQYSVKGVFTHITASHCTLYLQWVRTWMNHRLKSSNPSPFLAQTQTLLKMILFLKGELRRKYLCQRVRMWQADNRSELRPERGWIKHPQTATARLVVGEAAYFTAIIAGPCSIYEAENIFFMRRGERR